MGDNRGLARNGLGCLYFALLPHCKQRHGEDQEECHRLPMSKCLLAQVLGMFLTMGDGCGHESLFTSGGQSGV